MKLIKEKKIYTGNGVIENGYIRFDEKIEEVGDMAIFDYTVPSINLLLLDQFHVVLPRFLLFRILVSVKILNR